MLGPLTWMSTDTWQGRPPQFHCSIHVLYVSKDEGFGHSQLHLHVTLYPSVLWLGMPVLRLVHSPEMCLSLAILWWIIRRTDFPPFLLFGGHCFLQIASSWSLLKLTHGLFIAMLSGAPISMPHPSLSRHYTSFDKWPYIIMFQSW